MVGVGKGIKTTVSVAEGIELEAATVVENQLYAVAVYVVAYIRRHIGDLGIT